ncbi:Histone-lysine N-methyltransferase [Gracilaria domingensis]|nr:Histone-lysine N-methyltransferase [Gracilaria domingensis]
MQPEAPPSKLPPTASIQPHPSVVPNPPSASFSRVKGSKRHRLATDLISAPKRLKTPSEQCEKLAPHATAQSIRCVFCSLPGDIPECEGKLFGPFRARTKSADPRYHIYAHRNCAIWSPEVFVDDGGKIKDVHVANLRSRKKKCMLCADYGASLACSFRGAVCCRPMHFRCALRGGASLRHNYQVFCPKHAKCSRNGKDPPPYPGTFLDRTPIVEELITPGHGCSLCKRDSYNSDCGAILTCAKCSVRNHSKCLIAGIEIDTTFAALSWAGLFFCKNCMCCSKCNLPVDSHIYSADLDDENEVSDSVLCIACRHVAMHIECLPTGANPEQWRCESCRVCRHCNTYNIPFEKWSERYKACPDCVREIRNGCVVCPMCEKVYREGENLPMIQCDYCDKWIHADTCARMSNKKFLKMGKSKDRYRCPICTAEKKKRDQQKRRLSNSSADRLSLAMRERASSLDLDTVLKQMLVDEEDGMSFSVVAKASNHAAELPRVCEQLGFGSDVCRHCCSRGHEDSLIYCTDCGECYHKYCSEALSQSSYLGKETSLKANLPPTAEKTSRVGKLGSDAAAWRCIRCEGFNNLDIGATSTEPTKALNGVLPGATLDTSTVASVVPISSKPPGSNKPWVRGWKNGSVRRSLSLAMKTESERLVYEPLTWTDARKCCLCSHIESDDCSAGRLIPWGSSTVTDSSHVWVHVGCVMWSNGVTLHGSTVNDNVTLLGLRKNVVSQARRTTCIRCHSNGASIRCAAPGCATAYHLSCAKDVGLTCTLITTSIPDRNAKRNAKNHSGVIQRLLVFCPTHVDGATKDGQRISIGEALAYISMVRVVKVLDRQGYEPDSAPPRKKPLSADRMLSVRIGSLSVLKFGQLLPEVNDFIVKACLVPLGYCAARIFWSIIKPGERCVYFLEVCGHPQSGPHFVIRCSDAPQWRAESRCPDKAWSQVVSLVKKTRKDAGMADPSFQSIRTSGLEAFGLLNCIPVVTHIESLPMASMFNGRYNHKRVVTHKNNEIVFYNSLSKNFAPVKVFINKTGSARSEGYLPRRLLRERTSKEVDSVPSYENARTGAAFQLRVARDVFTSKEQPHERANERARTKCSAAGGVRNAKTKVTPHLPVATEYQGIAESSKRRTRVLRSEIEGWGVFATKNIPAGEMIIEYVGELIRPSLSDVRETKYGDRGIGCYMFENIPGEIVDATLCGNAARYINHSCAPNCYSKTIEIEKGRHVVVIMAKRRIQRGEELSYDYKFPFDDSDKVKCGCGTDQCRGYMN